MTASPLISVIVPVYNCAATLGRCVDSLLRQDYENFELLLVDDGSKDGSVSTLRRFFDRRIRLLAKENGGPASARNFGLDHCSPESELVCFVDSDDYVDRDYLGSLLAVGGDLAVTALVHHYPDGRMETQRLSDTEFTSFSDNREFLQALAGGAFNPPVGKLYSMKLIREARLRFPEIRLLEDVSFNFRYLEGCRSVRMADKATYHYVHRQGSETSRADMEAVDNYESFHRYLRSRFDAALGRDVDRFVYPQYMALIMRFLRSSDTGKARGALRREMVRRSFAAHRSSSAGEWLVKTLIRLRLFAIAMRLI